MYSDKIYLKAKVNLMKFRMNNMKIKINFLPPKYQLDLCSLTTLDSKVLRCDHDADLDSEYIHQTDVQLLKMEAAMDDF